MSYESVGGRDVFGCDGRARPKGVCIIIGMMSQYTSGGSDAKSAWVQATTLDCRRNCS